MVPTVGYPGSCSIKISGLRPYYCIVRHPVQNFCRDLGEIAEIAENFVGEISMITIFLTK